MMTSDWYKKIALMERADLVQGWEGEANLRERVSGQLAEANQEIDKLKAKLAGAQRARPLVLVGRNRNEIDYARDRMGIYSRNDIVSITTDDYYGSDKLRGRQFGPEDVRFVRGWSRGRYADDVRNELAIRIWRNSRQLGIDSISYAPDAYDE